MSKQSPTPGEGWARVDAVTVFDEEWVERMIEEVVEATRAQLEREMRHMGLTDAQVNKELARIETRVREFQRAEFQKMRRRLAH